MKRVISVILTLAVLIGMFSVFASAALPFTDVKEGKYYYNAVDWAVKNNVTAGITPTTFAPNQNCTRAQVVTFLWRAVGSPEPTKTTHPFTDVNAKAFYYKAMLWAVEKGVTSGLSATTFGPNESCTRGQVVSFLHRVAGKTAPTTTKHPFTDVNAKAFYYTSMLWAVEKGITSGLSATTFGPSAVCTRGQIVTFLYKYVTTSKPVVCEHTYDNDCDATCNKCGTTRTAPHKYDFNCDKDCNLCGAKRDVEHTYPSNPNGTYSKCACGLSHISIPGPITTDKDFVAAGETLTASVVAKDGLAPYTFKWQYKNATGWHTIEGKTTATVTFTVTKDMFDADKKLVLYVNASDADGYTASPMNYKNIGALGLLEVSFNEIAQVDSFMSRPGSSELIGVLPVYIDVKNANPNECTYKWEYSRKKDSGFKAIPTNAAGLDTDGINYTDPNYDAPAFVIKKAFLDTPVYIRVTVTTPDNQTVTVVSGPAYRKLDGSTISANFLTGSSNPQFAVTPYGGNGEYTYSWGYVYGGVEYIIGGPGTIQYPATKFQDYDTPVLTITRSNYNSMHITQMFCIIRSAGVSEKVYVNFN